MTFAVENRLELKKREDRLSRQQGGRAPSDRPPREGQEGAPQQRKRKSSEEGEEGAEGATEGSAKGAKQRRPERPANAGKPGAIKGEGAKDGRRPNKPAAKPKPAAAAKAAAPVKRDREDPISAALRSAPGEEEGKKKERAGKAKKARQEDDKFDELVERYKQRMMGIKL